MLQRRNMESATHNEANNRLNTLCISLQKWRWLKMGVRDGKLMRK